MTTTLEKMNGGTLTEASREWASRPRDQRFQSIADLSAAVNSRRSRSRSKDVDLTGLRVIATDDDDLKLETKTETLEFSNWSFGQMAAGLQAPAAYLRRLPAPLAARNLNHGLDATAADSGKRDASKLLMVDPVDDLDKPLSITIDSRLQAMTSPTYGRIWDADCVALAERLIDRSGGKFFNPLAYKTDERGFRGIQIGNDGKPITERAGLYASDHDIFMYLIDGGSRLEAGTDAHGNPDTLNRGFFISNSETGAATFFLQTFLFRETCGNNYVYGSQDVHRLTVRHSKNGPARFDTEAWPILNSYLNRPSAPDVSQILAAKQTLLPEGEPEIMAFAARHKITRPEVRQAMAYAKREEGDFRTVWQFVSGLTASARDIEHIDTRSDLEKRAGRIMESIEAPTVTTVTVDGFRDN